ncbi:MAG TPA: hypothetical protein VFC23_21700, partial [Thermoanaerobaculia bacterium]|nr:hypothetical protein [Thermoanaerobaculia bacterium]
FMAKRGKDEGSLVLIEGEILDPQISVPVSEAWLHRNPEAIKAVRRGIQEAEEGKAVSVGSFASYAELGA